MAGNQPIDVLLATYNGAKYLEPFLDSLAKQKDVDIHLIVSDDGSTDSTLEIVHRYKRNFPRVTVLEGPKKGPMNNFFFLLRSSQADYIALADQDDIWAEDHLTKSINRITDFELPALSFSAVEEFTAGTGTGKIWPSADQVPEFPSALFENIARGCTFVMNAPARELVNLNEPVKAIMHDWWIFLLVLLYGNTVYCPDPEVQYRLHEDNFIGVNNHRWHRFLRTLRKGDWSLLGQMMELNDSLKRFPQTNNPFPLSRFVTMLTGNLGERVTVAKPNNMKYRDKRFDDIKLRIGILFLPILNRNRKD